MEVIKAYKGFNKDMTCRDFQYEEGKVYETDKAEACECGFHASEYPLDVFSYYPPGTSVYHEVKQSGKLDKSESDKVASTKIKIGARIDIAGIVKAAISYIKERITNEKNAEPGKEATAGSYGAATAGDRGAATAGSYGAATAGYRGEATAGYRGAATAGSYGAATAGYSGAATAGDSGAATAGDSGAATAGDSGAATAGDSGAATAGYRGAATSRGSSASGESGLSVARGNGVKVKGGIGAVLVIAEEHSNSYEIKDWLAVVVDGVNVKADTWYELKNGELMECKDIKEE